MLNRYDDNGLDALRRTARSLYLKARSCDYLPGGRQIAEYMRPDLGIVNRELCATWHAIQALDENAPGCPVCGKDDR